MMISKKLGMNRLGAYRSVGAPWTRRLQPEAMNDVLVGAASQEIQVMVFVGNRGCIQIHSGPVVKASDGSTFSNDNTRPRPSWWLISFIATSGQRRPFRPNLQNTRPRVTPTCCPCSLIQQIRKRCSDS